MGTSVQFLRKITTTLTFLTFAYATHADEISIVNSGFENGNNGWNGGVVIENELNAPPEGTHYLQLQWKEGVSQTSQAQFQEDCVYTLSVWARSVVSGTSDASTSVAVWLGTSGDVISYKTVNVDAPLLEGDAETMLSDDGVNLWFDQGYRIHFSESPFCQLASQNPITDPWTLVNDADYEFDMAIATLQTSGGFKALYDTFYEDEDGPVSFIARTLPISESTPPDYDWDESSHEVVLEHEGSEFPWVIDAHLYEDLDTGRVWMSWGGHTIFVSEIDPVTGMLLGNPANKEFDSHPVGTHTPILSWPESSSYGGDPEQPQKWCGDQYSSCYMEGPALYTRDGYWYAFGSYGNLESNYTIRMGRSDSPTGPYVDKQGYSCLQFHPTINRYGASMLLGPTNNQRVPGHPSIWKEGGKHYLGYDYRSSKGEDADRMGIRPLHFVNGWPTIWMPIEVRVDTRLHPECVGEQIHLSVWNVSDAGMAGIDLVSIEEQAVSCLGDLDNDGFVGVSDVLQIIGQWGLSEVPADINQDGIVNVTDLLFAINAWGTC